MRNKSKPRIPSYRTKISRQYSLKDYKIDVSTAKGAIKILRHSKMNGQVD